jgi:nitroreductase
MKREPLSFETQEMRDLAEVIRGRRTINMFLQTPIPEELILEALDLSVWAPNHHVTEPWHFYLPGKETVGKILDLVREFVGERKGPEAGAFKAKNWSEKPGWLIVTCQKSDDPIRQQEDYASCAAAIQNLALYLWEAGVGTKWASGPVTREPNFYEIIGADPDKEFVVGLIWYGYPKITPAQNRSGLDEKLSRLP